MLTWRSKRKDKIVLFLLGGYYLVYISLIAHGCFHLYLVFPAEKVEEAPPLPVEAPVKPKSEKEQMEGFLDDLLD